MKTLITLFYKLTLKDYDDKIAKAKATTKMIVASTNGRVSHFYNPQGVKIRGWQEKEYKFTNIHPLVRKYQ